MKNVFILLITVLGFTLLFNSCEKQPIVEDDLGGFSPLVAEANDAFDYQPLPFKGGFFVGIEGSVKDISIPEISDFQEITSRDENCDNYNAIGEILDERDYCLPEYDPLYCDYLKNYYYILRMIYRHDCLPEIFCEQCADNDRLVWSATRLRNNLSSAGIHVSYLESIDALIERLAELCAGC